MLPDKPTLEWNKWHIQNAEIKYRQENKSEAYPDNPIITDNEIEQDIFNDPDFINREYEDFIEYFQTLIDKVANKYKETYYWTAEVTGFGWRDQSGEIDVFYEVDARKILEKILPNCECVYKIFMNRTGFKLQNFHHDSPVGNEWYEVRHITNQEFLKSEFN